MTADSRPSGLQQFNALSRWGWGQLMGQGRDAVAGWQAFWFTPRSPEWLGCLRILAGMMLFYTHLVWSIDFETFLGLQRMVDPEIAPQMNPTPWHWSHFDWVAHGPLLWWLHGLALASFLAFTVGAGMPWTGWLATAFAISYAHRGTGALFGLDQMNVALAMYLTLGGAGRAWSLDRWWACRQAERRGAAPPPLAPSPWVTIGTRLIQIQLCIIYWFAGTGKLQGLTWWTGEALWGAFASYQYQSIDMTWTYQYPSLLALATHLTIVWEISYAFLVWSPRTRPLMIAMAVMVHAGIGIFLGMMTFGYVMIVANLAFLEWGTSGRTADVEECRA